MDLALDQTQSMLQDSVRRILRDCYAPERRLLTLARPEGFDRSTWARLAAAGLLALGLDAAVEDADVATMVTMEELGRVAALEPFVSTVVQCGAAIQALGRDEQKSVWLPAIIEGRAVMAFVHPTWSGLPGPAAATARPAEGGGWLLTSDAITVADGAAADVFVVSARMPSTDEATLVSLFLVRKAVPGLRLRGERSADGRSHASLQMTDVHVGSDAILGTGREAALPVIGHVADAASMAIASEAVGGMSTMFDLTVAHLRTRQQFGVPLATFQALQHRLVDMSVAVEEARSMVLYGTLQLANADRQAATAAVVAARAQVCRACQVVGQQAIQLHGAIGLTEEYALAPYFLRASRIASEFGGSLRNLDQLAKLGGLYAVMPQVADRPPVYS